MRKRDVVAREIQGRKKLAKLNDILEAVDVDLQGLLDHLLSNGTEEGREVDDPVNPVLDNDLLQQGPV